MSIRPLSPAPRLLQQVAAALLPLALLLTTAIQPAHAADGVQQDYQQSLSDVIRKVRTGLGGIPMPYTDPKGKTYDNFELADDTSTVEIDINSLGYGGEEKIGLIIRKSDSYILGFHTDAGYFYLLRAEETVDGNLPGSRNAVKLGYDGRYSDLRPVREPGFTVGQNEIQAAVNSLTFATSDKKDFNYLKGSLATVIVAVAEAARDRVVENAIVKAIRNGNSMNVPDYSDIILSWGQMGTALDELTTNKRTDPYVVEFPATQENKTQTLDTDRLKQMLALKRPNRCATTARFGRAATSGCFRSDVVVSMGDSYISGEGGRWAGNAPDAGGGDSVYGTDRTKVVYGDTDTDTNKCHRSDSAEIKSIGDVFDIPKQQRINIACSGATTDHVLTDTYNGEDPQIKQLAGLAGRYNLKSVVVSIGGNDLGFSTIGRDCTAAAFGIPCSMNGRNDIKGKLPDVGSKVGKTLDAVRKTLDDAGQSDTGIILQSYVNPVPAARDNRYNNTLNPASAAVGSWAAKFLAGGCGLLDTDEDWLRYEVLTGLNRTLADTAHDKKAIFLNTQSAFAGHELCSNGSDQAPGDASAANPPKAESSEWVRWMLTTQGSLQEWIHPNYFGQKALGSCLRQTMERTENRASGYFTCYGSAGSAPENMRVAEKKPENPIPGFAESGGEIKFKKTMRVRNTSSGDLLDASWGHNDSSVSLVRDNASGQQTWTVQDEVLKQVDLNAGAPQISRVAAVRFGYGNGGMYGEAGALWPTVGDGPKGKGIQWATSVVGDDGSVQIMRWAETGPDRYSLDGCLTQDPQRGGGSAASVEKCGGDLAPYQRWWFDDGEAKSHLQRAGSWDVVPSSGQIVGIGSGQCMARAGAGGVKLAACEDSKDQQWQALRQPGGAGAGTGSAKRAMSAAPDPAPDGAFVVVNTASGLCLDVDQARHQVGEWACHGRDNQRWYRDGAFIRSKATGEMLFPGQGNTVKLDTFAAVPAQLKGGEDPKDGAQVNLTSATGKAIDLPAGNTTAGTLVTSWDPDPSKSNQTWCLHQDGDVWRIAPLATDARHLSYDTRAKAVALQDAVKDNKGEQWRLEPVGDGWYRIVSALDGTNMTAGGNGEPLGMKPRTGDPAQLWRITTTP
jgi:lysophospholipase L1-like esterase